MSVRLESANNEGLFRDSPFSQNSNYTAAGWFYSPTAITNLGALFELVNDPSTVQSEDWCMWFSDKIRVEARDAAGVQLDFNEGASFASADNWYYVTMYRSGDTLGVRVRPSGGSSADHISITGAVAGRDAATRFNIGRRKLTENPNNTRVAYVRAWTSVLSNAQLNAEAVSPTAVITANLWGSWKLTSHTDLTDDSGNGRTLSAGGTLSTEADPPDVITGAATTGAQMESTAPTVIQRARPNITVFARSMLDGFRRRGRIFVPEAYA